MQRREIRIVHRAFVAACLLIAAPATAEPAANLLANPGFEDSAGWSHGWTIENLNNNGAPYSYRLTGIGGGHGKARPRTGDNAIEIYSSDRVTQLSQQVTLEAGSYRLAAWVRDNGSSAAPQLKLLLGDQSVLVPTLSNRYRQYFADFTVQQAGPQRVGFISHTLGIALDDLSLVKLAGDETPPPFLFFDLSPTSEERSAGVQTCLRGQKQWVNFTISTDAPQLVKSPALRLTVPATVGLTGLNVKLIQTWGRSVSTDSPVRLSKTTRPDGTACTVTEFPIPRFVNGESSPVSFGGFWVKLTGDTPETLTVEVLEGGQPISSEQLQLVPIEPPARQRTPQRMKVVFYGVQDWKMDAADRLEALPLQFALMGGNVWSDYHITRDEAPNAALEDELVRECAAKTCEVKEFWPNHSSLLETGEGIVAWQNVADQFHDPDMFMVAANGAVNRHIYSLHYAAIKGEAWMKSAIRAFQRTMVRPQALGLSFRNTGFITDALEGVPVSFDPTTLADFARQNGLDAAQVTATTVQGALNKQWIAYNMKLYDQVAANLAQAIRQVTPQAAVVNTAGAYGPGGVGALSLPEQAAWAKSYDFTMPQWYAMGFFGDFYVSQVEDGLKAGIYGTPKGYADVIPLWNLSMGAGINDAASMRFQSFALLSATPFVRGIGYYIGTNAFADARTMVALADVHTLLAEVEDYYALGQRADAAVTFAPQPAGVKPIPAMGPDGKPMMLTPQVKTLVRVHRLGDNGRVALLTVVSHCNQAVGESGKLAVDLQALGADVTRDVVLDHLTGKKLPLTAELEVDTRESGSLAVLEIRNR